MRDLASDSQSSKVTFKNRADPSELLMKSLLGKGNKNIVDILLGIENVEDVIKDLIPEGAEDYIKEFESIKEASKFFNVPYSTMKYRIKKYLKSGEYTFKVKAFLLESPDKYDEREIRIIVPPYAFVSETALWLTAPI